MTNPSDPRDPGNGPEGGRPPGPGDSGGTGPTNYDAYRYPQGPAGPQSGPGYQGGPGYQDGPGFGQPQQPYRPDESVGAHDQFSYGGAGTWAINQEKNSVAPWALGVAILAVVAGLTIIGAAFSFIPGLIALILGIVAVVKARKIQGPGRRMGMSVTALVLAVIGILMTVAFFVISVMILQESGVMDCFLLPTPEEQEACLQSWADQSAS